MPPARSAALRSYGALGLTMLFWAGNAVVGRAVRNEIPPFTLAFGRWSLALALVLPFAIRPLIADWPVARRRWRPILFLGLVGVAAFNAFLYSGLHHSTASNGLLLQALIPAIVLLIGVVLFKDRVSPGSIAGVLLSTAGVAIIVFEGDLSRILGLALGTGEGLILCGCIAWAIYTACLRLRPAIQPVSFIVLTFAIGAAAMAPLATVELERAAIAWRPGVVAAFAYVAIFPSLLAYFLYNGAVARIGAAAAGQTISLMPLFGAVLAAQLLDEPLHPFHAAGMAMILGGIVAGWLFAARTTA